MHHCCATGAWVDLEEAKRILKLNLGGEFYHLEEDPDYPSGYKMGTSIGYNPCTFLTKDGLCSIHIANYSYKPKMCIEFPYEKGKLAPYIYDLCIMYKEARKKTRRTRRKKEKKCSGKK
jgi:Fe-S-cluster containining protein